MNTTFQIRVNGRRESVRCDGATPLLYVLRNDLSQNGPKFGCGLGQCGACSVRVDTQLTRSCTLPINRAAGRRITTVEGLGTPEKPDAVQAAFIAEQAAQCGYCTVGIVMTARALLDRTPRPTEAQVREALTGNLCRCGSHARVIKAVLRAAGGRS